MKTFLAGLTLVYLGLALWAQFDTLEWLPPNPWTLWTILLGVPVCTACLTTEVVLYVLPKRLFHRGVRAPVRRVALGLVAGVVGAALGGVSYVYLGYSGDVYSPYSAARPWFESALLGGGAAAGALLVLLPLPRVRRGRCVRCGYDLAAMTPRAAGKCAECGCDVMTEA